MSVENLTKNFYFYPKTFLFIHSLCCLTNYTPIQIRLLEKRLEKFNARELKETYINLRMSEFSLDNETTEILLTNLAKK